MKVKVTYTEGDFPCYFAGSRWDCRDETDRSVYDALLSMPDEKAIQMGKICVERIEQ